MLNEMPRIGVNYVPSENWWYAWHDWTPESIRRDLDSIAELGCDHVRIHCLWNWFQPSPRWLSPTLMARLVQLLDWCHERGLRVCLTLLDGWLSGFDFRPEWLYDIDRGRQRSIFTDPWALEQIEWYVRSMVEQTAHHPAAWCYDLSNEPDVLLQWNEHGTGDFERWAEQLMGVARSVARGKAVVTGTAHSPWIDAGVKMDRGFWATAPDITTVHAWPKFTGALDEFGEDSPASWGIADFLVQMALASQGREARPVWVQELGVAPEWLREMAVPDFTARMLDQLATTPVDTITWWSSHDVDRRFKAFAPLEYGLGLIDCDNHVKPSGAVFRSFAESRRADRPRLPQRSVAVVLPHGPATLETVRQWAEVTADGQPCTLVDAQLAKDTGYLTARGITTLISSSNRTAQ